MLSVGEQYGRATYKENTTNLRGSSRALARHAKADRRGMLLQERDELVITASKSQQRVSLSCGLAMMLGSDLHKPILV